MEEVMSKDDTESQEEHEVHAVGGRMRGTGGSAAKGHPPWPAGKTVNGYEFVRHDNDSLRSANLVISDLSDEQQRTSDREYVAMIAKCKASSSAYDPGLRENTSELSGSTEVPDNLNKMDLSKEVFTVDVQAMGAFALHARSIVMDNRNTCCRSQIEAKKKGKSKEVEGNNASLSCQQRRSKVRMNGYQGPRVNVSVGKTAANPIPKAAARDQALTSKTAEVTAAIKGRCLPDDYGSLGT
ncbi:hypothetical protein DXG01_005706 [Tephrocybe rancida]|nr:hypothetical protein DXG01_005706 [Tephrocybe rancida]